MPGKLKKPSRPAPRVVQPMRPKAVPPRAVPKRPAASGFTRSGSLNRAVARDIKRQAVRQTANTVQSRPRPVVRPAAPPQRVMPQRPVASIKRAVRPATTPAQAAARLKSIRRPVQPPPQPAPGLKSAHRAARGQAPTPQPPKVTGAPRAAASAAFAGLVALNVAAAHPQISAEATTLSSSLTDLQERSSFADIQADVAELDKDLNHALNLLESARDKGYTYQKDLEDIAYQAADQWQPIRDKVLTDTEQQAQSFQSRLSPLNVQVQRLNASLGNLTAATSLLGSTHTQVNTLLNDVSNIAQNIRNSYGEIESQVYQLTSRLTTIHWALGQLAEAKFKLGDGEDLVMAVPARWDQEGDDDPEGVLYLSNKRLVFERKEKVATKKVLFVAVAKELVQEVQIDQSLSNIKGVKAVNKGLFGHQDFIEVQFSDTKLGAVPFHLNGQDSKHWANLIERARSGDIENDRASGSGLSYADLTGPLTSADIMALQNEVNGLQDEMMLKGAQEELAEIENDVRSMERKLANLRARGYVIEKSLEADVAVLATQWDRVKGNAQTTVDSQTRLLSEQMQSIQEMVAKLVGMSKNLEAARPLFMQTKSSIASAEAQADAAVDAVLTQYDEYADEVESLTAHLEWVGWMLDALETASFQLLATESGVAATEAIWEQPGLEPENGVLFLTDQRILWEDRVGTFELKLDVPLQQVEDVQEEVDEESGQEYLVFTLGSGAPYPTARMELSMPVADVWLKMIGRARSGGYAQDRAVEIDEAELERIRNAPQQCSNCGAGLSAPILRGQTEITCEYCGLVTRI